MQTYGLCYYCLDHSRLLPLPGTRMPAMYLLAINNKKRVTGKVNDAAGNPLTGVNILEKGTINGAISGHRW